MADVTAKWKDGTATLYNIRRWQMLLPSGRWNYHLGWVMVLGRCYNQVGRWNSHRVYFLIVGREDQNLMRTIKEELYIGVNNSSLNRNIGKYHLPHIWDEVLHNTSELKITCVNKIARYTFSSDLRKPCLKTGKSLSLHWNNLFHSWEYPNYMISNRMRSIQMHSLSQSYPWKLYDISQ